MAFTTVTDYSFNPRAGTVTLTGVANPVLEQIISIKRAGATIYSRNDARNASLSGKVLTLPKGVVANDWAASDVLTITYGTNVVSDSSGAQVVQIKEPLGVAFAEQFAVRHDDDTPSGVDGSEVPLHTNSLGRLKVSSSPAIFDAVVGSISSLSSVVQIDVTRASNIVFTVTGTFTGLNIAFEATLDGTNWFSFQAVRSNSNVIEVTSGVINAAPVYSWEASVNAYAAVRIRTVNYATGPATVRIVPGAYATEPIPAIAAHQVSQSGIFTTTPVTPAAYTLITAATTNVATIKSSGGMLWELTAFNGSAAIMYWKLFNKATAPVVGTDIPILTIPLPSGTTTSMQFGALGKRFALGIGSALTAASDAAATAGLQLSATYS